MARMKMAIRLQLDQRATEKTGSGNFFQSYHAPTYLCSFRSNTIMRDANGVDQTLKMLLRLQRHLFALRRANTPCPRSSRVRFCPMIERGVSFCHTIGQLRPGLKTLDQIVKRCLWKILSRSRNAAATAMGEVGQKRKVGGTTRSAGLFKERSFCCDMFGDWR